MDPGSALLGLAVVVLVAAFVLRPVLQPAEVSPPGGSRRLSQLQAERDRILDSLREIDLDHDMGKLLEQDYRAQREALATRGANVLRQIDEVGGARLQPGRDAELELDLEAAVMRLRRSDRDRRPAERFCGKCGTALQDGDRFCANCGAPVSNAV